MESTRCRLHDHDEAALRRLAEAALLRSVSRAELERALTRRRSEGAKVESHPLGFLRLPLGVSDRRQPGFYLHVWSPEVAPSRTYGEGIHCHMSDISSRILCGQLTNAIYAVDFDEAGPHFLYDIVFEGTRSRRVATQKHVTCRLAETVHCEPGQIYDMPKNVFHSTVVANVTTATLMLKTGVDPSVHPYSVWLTEMKDGETFEHVPAVKTGIGQDTAWALLERVVASMAPPGEDLPKVMHHPVRGAGAGSLASDAART